MLQKLQLWSWNFAERVVEGIVRLKGRLRRVHAQAFPTVGTGPDDAPAARRPRTGCPGCDNNMAKNRREHNRIEGQCRFPADTPEPEWSCPGCKHGRPRAHHTHTDVPGECRWAVIPLRRSSTRTRRQQHPRETRQPATADPTANLQGNELIEGQNSSSSAEGNIPPVMPPPPSGDAPAEQPLQPERSPAVRGPDLQPRAQRQDQRRVVDQSVGQNPSDWTSFDVSTSLRVFRVGTEAQQRRELRKLHLRWWHAGRAPMERILAAAGIPQKVIHMIPDILDTCRECRMWKRPAADITPSIELTVKQNEVVEADILFYKTFMAWHMVDRADRFEASQEIQDKTTQTHV